jgi:hypothetical protein
MLLATGGSAVGGTIMGLAITVLIIIAYRTKAGVQRYAIGYTLTSQDGTQRPVTRRRGADGKGWTTYAEAAKALREALAAVDAGTWVDPSRQPAGDYLDEWAAGLRLAPSTLASYRKNIRLHIKPYVRNVPLAQLTTARIDAMCRKLETSGRPTTRKGPG